MSPFYVSKIFAHQFRNLDSFSLSFHSKLNVLFGQNGQGKTNIIEAISLALSTKPLRPVKHVSDLIKHSCNQGKIELHVGGAYPFSTSVHLFEKGKKFELDGKFSRDSSPLNQRVAVVSFVPEELQIVSASSSFRRRAINQIASGFFATYLSLYRKYERALLSRNQLLKSSYLDPRELESFNHVYASLSAEITKMREESISLWLPFFLSSVKEILGEKYDIQARYVGSASSDSKETLEHLSSIFSDERTRRATLLGPHLDDLEFLIDKVPTRFVASRGQARGIVLALKLGQLNALAKVFSKPTVLLLDDVAGELDPEKVGFLMQTISGLNVQTFLTTTHLENLVGTKDYSSFQIENGSAL